MKPTPVYASAVAVVLASCGAAPRPPQPTETKTTVAVASERAATTPDAPTPPSAPAAPSEDLRAWLDECEASFRAAAARLTGFGPIITWRDGAARWYGAYEVFIHAAAADPSLVEGAEPHPDDDAIIFALDPSLKYRIVLVSKDCVSGSWQSSTTWTPADNYTDPDEIHREGNGVSAAIHYDGHGPRLRADRFLAAFRSPVDTCIMRRPPLRPKNACPADPG